jgi:hypothetical protein
LTNCRRASDRTRVGGLIETQPALFERHETRRRADHQMIEHVNIENFPGLHNLARDRDILYTYMENVVWESLMV